VHQSPLANRESWYVELKSQPGNGHVMQYANVIHFVSIEREKLLKRLKLLGTSRRVDWRLGYR
jgi:hypothetical protein